MTLTCGDCGALMVQRTRRRDGKRFFGCSRFPDCHGTHGAHPDGRPLGTPADAATRAARRRAHAAFDPIWQNSMGDKKRARGAAYEWLQRALGLNVTPHIGEMTIDGCEMVVTVCRDRMAQFTPAARRYDVWEYIATEVAP